MEKRKQYYQTITRRLLIAFFCLTILPILAVAWIMKDAVEETNITKLREQATATIEHRAEVISIFLENKVALLNMLAGFYSREFFATPGNTEKLFTAIGSRGDIVDLQVIDASGHQYAYVGPYRAMIEGKTYDEAQWFRETLISGVHISNVFTGFRNVPHFVVAVTDSLKSYVLRATINSSIFNSLLHSAQFGPNGDAFIINRDGQLQTPSLLGRTNISETERMLISYDSKNGPYTTATDIYTTRWIGNGHWVMILKANIDDSLGFYLSTRNRIIAIVLIISILALIAASFTAVLLSRNLRLADQEHAANSMQFAHMEKMATIGRLAAGIAHEINNPLQMITNRAGWIKELLPEEDPTKVKNLSEYQESVEQISYHVKRAGTITHRLLGFSKKISAEKEQVQINNLINETLSFVEKEADSNEITIIKDLDATLPTTMTDGPQLQQVFLNLINNAMDAIGRRGVIDICTSQTKDDELLIEIGDNGPGIKPENLKQIFDPFFTTKDPDKGTGLGLYISYDIIKKLGGAINAGNKTNGGARFTITLPIVSLGKA